MCIRDSHDIGHREIDSRPSDALATAIRMHSPILVADEVMREGVLLEDELDEEIQNEPEIQLLENQLQKAIDKEDYEIAAKIRDKIKEIES